MDSESLIPINSSDETDDGEKKTSNPGAIFNFVCTTLGAGILSIPNALKYAGWFGVILLIILGVVSNYTAKMLIKCMHMVPKRRLRTYEDIGEASFGRIGTLIVGLFQNFMLFGACVVYLILIGENMAQLFSSSCMTYHDWILVIVALLLPFTWLKTMREISFIALFGLMASLAVAFVVITVGLFQWIEDRDSGEVNTHQVFTSFGGVIKSFNLAIFSFGVHPVLPTLEHSMAKPAAFPLVSDVSFLIITPVYVLVGLAGYAGWGDTLVASGNILTRMTLSYGSSGFLAILIKAIIAIITLHIVLAFPLPMNPINLNVESVLKFDLLPKRRELFFRIMTRTTIVALAVLVASVVPYFGDVLGLISAFAGISVAFILPPVFYYVLSRKYDVPLSKLSIVIMGLVACLGLFGMGVGLYYAITGLVSDIQSNGNPFDGFFSACTTTNS